MLQAELGAAPIKSSPPPVQPKLTNLGVPPTVKIEPIVVQDLFMDTPQGKTNSDPTPKASRIQQDNSDLGSDSSVRPNDGISALGIHPPIISPAKSLLPELPVPEEYHFEGQVFHTLDKVIEASAKELKIDTTHVNWLRSMIEVIVMTNVNNVYNALRNKIYQHKEETTGKFVATYKCIDQINSGLDNHENQFPDIKEAFENVRTTNNDTNVRINNVMGDLSLLNSNIVNVSQNVENSARYI
jgi:hypothetical protein